MSEEKLLTIREVSLILGISEKEVIEGAQQGKIPAYKIGGVYLRFKREQIEEFKKKKSEPNLPKKAADAPGEPKPLKPGFRDKINDFFYFNDFYILTLLIILLILVIILRRY